MANNRMEIYGGPATRRLWTAGRVRLGFGPPQAGRWSQIRNIRNIRNFRDLRNYRNNFVAPGISARENRAGGRLRSLRRETRGGKKFFLQNEPNSLLESTKEMASFGFDRPKKPPKSQSKPLIEGLCNGF